MQEISDIFPRTASETTSTMDSNPTDEDGWQLILVNREHPLPDNYQVELTELSNGEKVATSIYPALQQMFDDMRAEGIYPIVASGYRTHEEQQQILDEKNSKLSCRRIFRRRSCRTGRRLGCHSWNQ